MNSFFIEKKDFFLFPACDQEEILAAVSEAAINYLYISPRGEYVEFGEGGENRLSQICTMEADEYASYQKGGGVWDYVLASKW